jgi:dTMP kinase
MGNQDRFEQTDLSFHQRVREGYLKMAKDEPARWQIIDGTQPKDQIKEIIWQLVNKISE